MTTIALTDAAVRKLKPGLKRIEVRDAHCRGLTLVIQPSGYKSWTMRLRDKRGKLVRKTLGPVALDGKEAAGEQNEGLELTLLAARTRALDIKRRRKAGEDVVGAMRKEANERELRDQNTFDQAVLDFVEQHVRRKLRRWESYARLLGVRPMTQEEEAKEGGPGLKFIAKGLASRWSGRQVGDIDQDDIFRIVNQTKENGTPGVELRSTGPSESRARIMFAVLSKMFSWLMQQRRCTGNPCIGVHKPDASKSRDRILADAEIVAFWKASEKANRPFGHALKMLLLTGCRLNEVCGMRRSEISDDGKVWTIPGERTKNHRTHVVPLSRLAQDILADVGTVGEHVFTTDADGATHISGWSKTKARVDALMLDELASRDARNGDKVKSGQPWRLHDLRRTCATGMAEIGIAPHIVEACLNHVSGAKAGVAGTYNRAAYAVQKKAALERWAEHLDGLLTERTATVIPLQRKGA